MNDAMPSDVATALLLSGQSMSNRFRKVCKQAREKICEPVSRSTALSISAPKTPMQRFELKLRKANAKQLTTWLQRASRKGNELQDTLFHAQQNLYGCPDQKDATLEHTIAIVSQRIEQIDGIAQAINLELTSRASRSKLQHV